MDKEIENSKSCRGCEIAANAPLVKFNLWPKIDRP